MSLLDEMNQDVIAYRPERPGEGVEGELVARDVTGSDYTSDDIPVLTLKQDDGTLRGVRGYHKVLRDEIARADLNIGDRVAIVFEGKKPNKKNTGTYWGYKVRVQRASSAPAAGGGSQAADDEPPF